MIAVDTSALMAVLLSEAAGDACDEALQAADTLLISAVTATEARIVAAGRSIGLRMDQLLDTLNFTIEPVNDATARRVAAIYARWGKGINPAALNFGDCFAYDLAKQRACPLLFVGDGFARTDIVSALSARSASPRR